MPSPFRSRVLIALAGATLAGAADIPSWDHYAAYAAGADARQVQVLDVNGDGRPDLLIADPAAAAIQARLNLGDGVFADAVAIGPALSGVRMMALGDLAGDGATDIVAIRSNGLSDEAVVLVRDATGFSAYARKTFAPAFDVQDVATGLISGGSQADIVVSGRRSDGTGAAVQVLLNQRILGFSDPVSTALADNSGPAALAIAKVDGDVHPDVLVALQGSGEIGLFYNTSASGTFSTAIMPAGAGARHIAVQSDASGVATLIAMACETADSVVVFQNLGGLLSPPLPAPLPAGTAPRQVRSADLDADGDADIAVLGTGDRIHLLLNQAGQLSCTGTLADRFPPTGTGRQLRIADVSGDGRLDLLMLRTDGTTGADSDNLYIRLSQQQGFASSSSIFRVDAIAPVEWGLMSAQVREFTLAPSGWMAATVWNTMNPSDAGFVARRNPGNGTWENIGLPALPGARYDNLDLRVNITGDIAVTCTSGPVELMAWYGSGGTWTVPSTAETTQAWDVDRDGVAFLGGRTISGSLHPGIWMNGLFVDHFLKFGSHPGNVMALSGARAVGVTANDVATGPFWPVYNADISSGTYVNALPPGGSFAISQPPVANVDVTTIERARIVDGGIAYDFQPDDGVYRHVVVYQTNAGIGSSANLIHVAPAAGHDSASLQDARQDGVMLLRSWAVGDEGSGTALLWSSTFRIASPVPTRLTAAAGTAYASSITDDGAILSSGGLAIPTPTVSIVAIDADAAQTGDTVTVRLARTGSPLAALNVPLDTTAFTLQEPAPIIAMIPAGHASLDVTLTLAAALSGEAAIAVLPAGASADAEHNFRLGQRSSVAITGGSGNQAPTLSVASEAFCNPGLMTPLTLTVGDDSTPAASLTVACVSSSDPAIIATGDVLVGGSTGTRTANVHVNVAAPTGYAVLTFRVTDGDGASTERTVTCKVGDVSAVVTVSDQVNEDSDPAGAFTVTLSHPAPPGGIVVHLGYSGSASAYGDYQSLPSAVTVPAGQFSAVIPVAIIDDLVPEEAETIEASIGAGLYAGSPTPATLAIPRSDVQHWVFWIQHHAIGGTDQGTGQLVWWMTSVRPVASAVFHIPGKPDVAAEVENSEDQSRISYPFWRVFGQDAIAMADLQAYLPSSANADDLGYTCEITYSDGLPNGTELRRGSFLGFAGGYDGIPIASNLTHGTAVSLLDGEHLLVEYDGPLNYLSVNPFNGRLGDRSRWEGRPDQQGAVGNSFTAPPILVAGQPYLVELMRGRFSPDNGRDDLGGPVGLCYSNFYLVTPGGAALPVFNAGSDDLASTLLGAMPAASGVAGSETVDGASHAITAAIAHESVTIPGTAGSVAAVRLTRTWNDGLSSASMWLAKDANGDVYVLRRERRAPANPTAAVSGDMFPELLLAATTSPPWFLGADGACSVATGQTAAGNGIGGCTQVLAVYETAPPTSQSLWSKPGMGLVAGSDTVRGSAGDSWHLAPPVNPLPSLNSAAGAAVNGAFAVTCSFSEPVTGFAAGDISISGGTVSAFAGSGASYSWTVTPTANVSLSISAGKCAATTGGLPNLASNVLSRTFDAVKPTVVLSAPALVHGPFTVTATFSEPVSGFTSDDVVVTNGAISDFGSGDGRVYTWTTTPAASGAVTVAIAAGVAGDAAGNANTAAATLSRTADLVAPTVALSTPAAAAVRSAFTITITFSEPVSGFTADDLVVSGASKGAMAVVTANRVWTCALTPLAATTGTITAGVPGGAASDGAGNGNAPSATLERIGDTVAPVLTLSSEAPATVSGPFEVLVTGLEPASTLEAADFTLVNARLGTIVQDGAIYGWICTVHPIANGPVSVAVKAAAVADQAGNTSPATTALTRTFADATPPTVALTAPVGAFAKAAFTVTATFSEAPTGFALADVAASNAVVSALAGTGLTRTFLVTPGAAGTVSVQIPAGGWSDPNGVASAAASNALTTVYDAAKPAPTLASAAAAKVNAPFTVGIDFGEPVEGFALGDLGATNATLSAFSGVDGDSTYTVVVTPTANGTVTLALAAGKALDRAGNANAAAVSLTRTYDSARPTVVLASTATAVTRIAPILVTATFSEAVTGLEVGDLTVDNADVIGLASSDGGKTWSLSLVPNADGEVGVLVPADAAADAAGNGNQASAALTRISDRTAPSIILTSAAEAQVAGSFALAITCSEAVTGLAATDLVVSNGTVVGFAGTGASYTCSIRPSALGTVTVSIAAGAAADAAGNPSLAASPLIRTVTIVNDACADATAISGWKGALAASNLGSTAEAGEPAHAGIAAAASAWWVWEAPETGTLTLDTIGSLIDTQLALYTGPSITSLTKVAANANISDTVRQSKVVANVTKGTSYRIAVDGKSGAKGLLSLNWSLVAGNNPFTGARAITGTSGSDSSGTWNATRDSGEVLAKAIGAGRTVWWTYTAPTDGTLHLDSSGSGIDTVLAVASGSSVSALTVLAQDDEVPGDAYAEVGIKVKAGQAYRVLIDAAAGAGDGSVVLNWSLDAPGDG